MQDEPTNDTERQMLADRNAKMDALVGRTVRLVSGSLAVIVKPYSPEVVNVVTLDGLIPMTNLQAWTLVDHYYLCRPVFWRHESRVQYVSLVQQINEDQRLDLLVLSDGYVDLGAGPGVPVAQLRVAHGMGRGCWLATLDT